MTKPSLRYEKKLIKQGYWHIAGLDEVGRGSLAGPVVAAAVILPCDTKLSKHNINDSKLLTPKQREQAFIKICENSYGIGVGIVSNDYIDKKGIVCAVSRAFLMAINKLLVPPDHLLIDGNNIELKTEIPYQTIIKGDQKCLSIAAASIIAKVTRDKMMVKMSKNYQKYLFFKNKGYGTKDHINRIKKHGPSCVHRISFLSKMN